MVQGLAWAKRLAISTNNLGVVVHACDPSYVGGSGEEDHGLRLAPGKNAGFYLKNNCSNKGWVCGSTNVRP
jgi:hypothetical protein